MSKRQKKTKRLLLRELYHRFPFHVGEHHYGCAHVKNGYVIGLMHEVFLSQRTFYFLPRVSADLTEEELRVFAEEKSMAMKRPKVDSNSRKKGKAFFDDAFAKQFPCLYEHLSEISWDDGEPRKTSTLFIFAEGGQVTICVGERNEDRSLWTGAETVQEALQAAEEALAVPLPLWREKRRQEAAGAPRKNIKNK